MEIFKSLIFSNLFIYLFLIVLSSKADEYTLSACSWLGGSSDSEYVAAMRIQSDGAIVIAANIGNATLGGTKALLLNKSTDASSGAVIRLTADGKKILSIARVALKVLDMAIDGNNRVYIAAAGQGIIALNNKCDSLLWTLESSIFCRRIDAGSDGTIVALNSNTENAGTVYLVNNEGKIIKQFPGYQKTQDVAIESNAKMIFLIGFENKNSPCNPVQVAYLKALNYSGEQLWKNYDWPGSMLDDCRTSGYENNMADTRGYRVTVGKDGLLYCAFESAGGNHIFRRDPRDLLKPVTIVGGDWWHNWANTKSEHKIFFAKYIAKTGEYLLGQQFCTRIFKSGQFIGNSVRIKDGDICADERSRVYVCGEAAYGLPFLPTRNFIPQKDLVAYNPFSAEAYTGGSFILIMDSTFSKRLVCTRLCGGCSRTVDARIISGQNFVTTVWGGSGAKLVQNQWLLDTASAIQPNFGGESSEGFFAVMNAFGQKLTPEFVVLYSDSYTVSNQLLRDSKADISSSDIDNDAIAECVTAYAFSSSKPLSPTNGYWGQPFYGAIVGYTKGIENKQFDESHIKKGKLSELVVRLQTTESGKSSVLHAVIYFDKKDFIGYKEGIKYSFGKSSFMLLNTDISADLRWLVRDADTFFVSQQSIDGTAFMPQNNNSDGMWAKFKPEESVDFDSASALFYQKKFTDITAVGFIRDGKEMVNTTNWLKMKQFLVSLKAQGNDTAAISHHIQNHNPHLQYKILSNHKSILNISSDKNLLNDMAGQIKFFDLIGKSIRLDNHSKHKSVHLTPKRLCSSLYLVVIQNRTNRVALKIIPNN